MEKIVEPVVKQPIDGLVLVSDLPRHESGGCFIPEHMFEYMGATEACQGYLAVL
jgi:hypothetical protein